MEGWIKVSQSLMENDRGLVSTAVGLSVVSVLSLVFPPAALLISAIGCAWSARLLRRTGRVSSGVTLAVCMGVFVMAAAIQLLLVPASEGPLIVGPAS